VIRPIEINARFLTQPITGVQRFAVEMVSSLDRQLAASSRLRERYRFRLIAPESARELELEHIPLVRAGRLQGHAWEQLELPPRTGRRVLLNFCNTAPLLTRNVVTIHDAAVFALPDAHSRAFRLWYRALLPSLGRRAVRVLTVSQFSRNELVQRAGIPPGKVEIVPQGCEHVRRAEPDQRVFARLPVSHGRYVLAVGSQAPHKNLTLLEQALVHLGEAAPPLVIAGSANPRVFGGGTPARGERVHLAGYVTDGELRALYEGACCFVYPSLYEGFGIPPLEAMVCGCPTIVSRAAALPEVCADAALYCDPYDAEDLARNIRRLIRDSALQNDLRQRGLARTRAFTWERSSRALLDILDRAVAA
jgi:glycosyltransferase involved in cell wall biosynthesis